MQEDVELLAGLDLGKLSDFSAFALFERRRPQLQKTRPAALADDAAQALYGKQTTTTAPKINPFTRQPYTGELTKEERRQRQWQYRLVRMKRWDVGTSYEEVVSWLVKAYSRSPEQKGLAGTTLAVDYTGVGVAVVEWLRKEMSLGTRDPKTGQRLSAKALIRPIWIQSGKSVNENDAGGWNVPKKELVSVLQVLMGSARLTIEQNMENCGTLVRELENFKVKQNLETGHESYEAWREHDHDDMVLAAAVGLWTGECGQKEFWVR